MKSRLLYSLILLVFGVLAFAQANELTDIKAKKLLQKLRDKYESYTSIEVQFDLLLHFEDGSSEYQNGSLIQDGDKYLLDSKDQAIYSDGKTVWVHLKNNNEVQIDNVYPGDDEDLSSLSPKELLKEYDNGSYEYGLVYEGKEGMRRIAQIEFKPLEEDTDFFKMRLTIDQKKKEIIRMKAFQRDGSNFLLEVKDVIANESYDNEVFIFDSSKYPNIYIEDLRID